MKVSISTPVSYSLVGTETGSSVFLKFMPTRNPKHSKGFGRHSIFRQFSDKKVVRITTVVAPRQLLKSAGEGIGQAPQRAGLELFIRRVEIQVVDLAVQVPRGLLLGLEI